MLLRQFFEAVQMDADLAGTGIPGVQRVLRAEEKTGSGGNHH